MTIVDLRDIHAAAKAIEKDGLEGLQHAQSLAGAHAALALAIAHARINCGSMGGWPPDPDITPRVNELLSERLGALYKAFESPALLFYSDEGYCLDNFSAFAVRIEMKLYPTAEHAYQALKYFNPRGEPVRTDLGEVIPIKISEARSAHEAKKLGGKFEQYRRKDWSEDVKLANMEFVLREKYAQHEYVRRVLERSVGKVIIENSHQDAFWGRGADWTGMNMLGKLWMKIRDGT
jgi:ribA/ribD-fused uncharacterized protein